MAVAGPTLFRFTREQYHRMAEEGLFAGKRVELLDGEVVERGAKRSEHSYVVNRLMYMLPELVGDDGIVRVQEPVVLDDGGEPEPGLVVCVRVPDGYAGAHPRADQVLLAIEVAESSLAYDRTTKLRAYARAGVPRYWIVNLLERRLEACADADPAASSYRTTAVMGEQEQVSVPTGGSLAISAFLPPRG